MGKRLTRIYTRTGDDGTTGLGNGLRSGKESLRIEAIGAVDELNSHIGVLLSQVLQEGMRNRLENIQHDLFDLGGDLSIPGRVSMSEAQISRLEQELDEYNATLASAEGVHTTGRDALLLPYVMLRALYAAGRKDASSGFTVPTP